jgi:serine O-acetyltransferase
VSDVKNIKIDLSKKLTRGFMLTNLLRIPHTIMRDDRFVDWSKPIWEREIPNQFWDPGRKLLKCIRQYQALKQSKNPINIIRVKICVIRHMFWSVITGAQIDLTCNIGGGLLIPHPNGIVIHPNVIIGPNCLIFQQVTLTESVEIGFHVDIGAGAKVLGPLRIENNARVGANSVVTRNVARGITVAGAPARQLNSKSNQPNA